MEILYVIGMIAVFVLCLALLSTARRILRSSPLSNAQFGASRMYEVEHPEEEALAELSSAKLILSSIESEYAGSDPVGDETVVHETVVETSEAAIFEAVLVKTVAAEAVIAESIPLIPADTVGEQENTSDIERPWVPKWARFHKPSRQTYNYALECVLLGVSAWVLIRTQRSTLRLRAPLSARDRVA